MEATSRVTARSSDRTMTPPATRAGNTDYAPAGCRTSRPVERLVSSHKPGLPVDAAADARMLQVKTEPSCALCVLRDAFRTKIPRWAGERQRLVAHDADQAIDQHGEYEARPAITVLGQIQEFICQT